MLNFPDNLIFCLIWLVNLHNFFFLFAKAQSNTQQKGSTIVLLSSAREFAHGTFRTTRLHLFHKQMVPITFYSVIHPMIHVTVFTMRRCCAVLEAKRKTKNEWKFVNTEIIFRRKVPIFIIEYADVVKAFIMNVVSKSAVYYFCFETKY